MERKFHNSAATPDGTLSTAKAYKTSYITMRNVLMGRAGACAVRQRQKTEALGGEGEREKQSDDLNQ